MSTKEASTPPHTHTQMVLKGKVMSRMEFHLDFLEAEAKEETARTRALLLERRKQAGCLGVKGFSLGSIPKGTPHAELYRGTPSSTDLQNLNPVFSTEHTRVSHSFGPHS